MSSWRSHAESQFGVLRLARDPDHTAYAGPLVFGRVSMRPRLFMTALFQVAREAYRNILDASGSALPANPLL